MSRFSTLLLVIAALVILVAGVWLFAATEDVSGVDLPSATGSAEHAPDNAAIEETQPDPSVAAPISASAFHETALAAVQGAVVGTVMDADGSTVADARIGLHEFLGKEPVLNAEMRITRSTTTDEQGRFELPCSEFPSALLVEAGGFLPEVRTPVTAGDVVRIVLRAGARHEFLVSDAVDNKSLPGVKLRITRGAHLPPCQLTTGEDGRACADTLLSGAQDLAVLAPRHLDQSNVTVQIEATRTATTELRLERGKRVFGVVSSRATQTPIAGARVSFLHKSSLTDAEGRYELTGLPPVHVSLRALATGHLVLERGTLLAGSRGQAEVDFELTPSASITGVVLDDAGRPLRGALVLPMGFDAKSRNQSWDPEFLTYAVRSGEDGRFCLGGFSFGEDALGGVLVECPPWLPTTSSQLPLPAAGTLGDLTVRMKRPDLILRGRVTNVTDEAVAGADVLIEHSHRMSAHRESDAAAFPLRRRTRTGADGCFEIANLPPGTGFIECAHEGSKAREHYNIWPPRSDALKIVLRKVNRITAVCRDEQDVLLVGASVTLLSHDSGMSESGTSGADGRVQFQMNRAGPWRVRATAPGCKELRQRDLMPDADGIIALKFTSSNWLRFEVREKGSERIPTPLRITSQVKGEIQLDASSVHPDRETGCVRMAVPSGPQTILIRGAGMLGCVRDVDVPSAGTLDLGRIELEAGVSADGYVRLADGRPVRGARIAFRPQARAADMHFRHLVNSSQDGWFHSTGLPPGLHEIAVESEFAPLTIFPAVEISANAGKGLELMLHPESVTQLRVPADWLGARLKTVASNRDAAATNLANNYSEFFSSRGASLRFTLTNKDHKALTLTAGTEDREFGPGWIASPERQIPVWGSHADLQLLNLPRGSHHLTLQRRDTVLFERDFETSLGELTVVEPPREPAKN